MIREEIKKLLPLEFQHIKAIEKKQLKKNKSFVKVEFYQSNKVKPENFYKPISKIVLFE